MTIYDCFTYFNETDVVDIRFSELGDVVDYFVVVEADQTFTGQPKPFYFDDLSIPDDISKKIIRVQISFPEEEMSAWDREAFQRDQIVQGVASAEPNDVVIISDADEIPRASVLKSLSSLNLPVQLDVVQYFWDFHWQVPQHCNQGGRPVIARVSDLQDISPQKLRATSLFPVPDAGWHFSFLGETEKIVSKVEAFAHTEYDTEEYKNAVRILSRRQRGIDPFDRFPLKYTEIDDSYPFCVRKGTYNGVQ